MNLDFDHLRVNIMRAYNYLGVTIWEDDAQIGDIKDAYHEMREIIWKLQSFRGRLKEPATDLDLKFAIPLDEDEDEDEDEDADDDDDEYYEGGTCNGSM
jgi:hypothetical protein